MHPRYKKGSDVAALLGAVEVVFGFWLFTYCQGFETIGQLLLATGVFLIFISFILYVRAKGYRAWWCLLFLASGPGAFLVFWFLPNRHHEQAAKT